MKKKRPVAFLEGCIWRPIGPTQTTRCGQRAVLLRLSIEQTEGTASLLNGFNELTALDCQDMRIVVVDGQKG